MQGCLICFFIDLAMTDAFKAAYRFKSAAKTTDTCEHIKKSDSHMASDRSYLIVISPRFCGSLHTAHTHNGSFALVMAFVLSGILLLFFLFCLFLRKLGGGQCAE